MKIEARIVEIDSVNQSGCGSVMEKRRARGETTQYRSFDLANMVEPAIDQSLAQIGCGFAVVGQETRSRASFAHGYLRQKAHIEASQIDGGVACTGVAGPDVQGRREGVVTDIRCVV